MVKSLCKSVKLCEKICGKLVKKCDLWKMCGTCGENCAKNMICEKFDKGGHGMDTDQAQQNTNSKTRCSQYEHNNTNHSFPMSPSIARNFESQA